MSPINAHPLSDGLLAEVRGKPKAPQIQTKKFANIHPEDGQQSRNALLRIIIPDKMTVTVPNRLYCAAPKSPGQPKMCRIKK
jgi:hypothetical protein